MESHTYDINLQNMELKIEQTFLENMCDSINSKHRMALQSKRVEQCDQHAELLHIANSQISKIMKEYIESRTITEAKTDIFDNFSTQMAEAANEKGIAYFPASFETVGSRGEGFGFLANDSDLLATMTTTSACFPSPEVDLKEDMFVIDTNDCHPGYCRLKFHRQNRSDSLILSPEYTLRKGRDLFLCNNAISKEFQEKNKFFHTWFIHGPALTSEDLCQDWVIAIRCINPDRLYSDYISRIRNWPSPDVLAHLKSTSYAVVSASHHTSAEPCLEFRISFASAEKFLIRNFSDIQFACYYFLKIIKVKVEEETCEERDIFKSYFVKTAVLWVSEKLEPCIWTDENFLLCVSTCISYLHYCFRVRNLPQLFMKENNLIDHIPSEDCKKIANALKKYVSPMNPKVFLSCLCDGSFDQHFNNIVSRPRRDMAEKIRNILLETTTSNIAIEHISPIMEVDTLSYVLGELVVVHDHIFCQILYNIIQELEHIVKPVMVACMRPLLYRFLASIIHRQPRFLRSNIRQAEELYTMGTYLTYPISLYDDQGLSGYTSLSVFHYLNGDFMKAFHILCSVESILHQTRLIHALSIIFTRDDILITWRDDFFTTLIATYADKYLMVLPVKSNVLAVYILSHCIRKIFNNGKISSQIGRLTKLKRSLLSYTKELVMLDENTHLCTLQVLDVSRKTIESLFRENSI